MTEREWVTLAVKGGYLGDKDLIENKNFFTRNLFLWIPMLCLTAIITYCLTLLKMNTNDIWYLCIAFLLYPMFYGTGTWKEKLHSERSVLNDGRGYCAHDSKGADLFIEYKRSLLLWLIPMFSLLLACAFIFGIMQSIFLLKWHELPTFIWYLLYFFLLLSFKSDVKGHYYSFKLGALSNYIKSNYILGENNYDAIK